MYVYEAKTCRLCTGEVMCLLRRRREEQEAAGGTICADGLEWGGNPLVGNSQLANFITRAVTKASRERVGMMVVVVVVEQLGQTRLASPSRRHRLGVEGRARGCTCLWWPFFHTHIHTHTHAYNNCVQAGEGVEKKKKKKHHHTHMGKSARNKCFAW